MKRYLQSVLFALSAFVILLPVTSKAQIIYASSGGNGNGHLFRIDVSTQAVVDLGATGFNRVGGLGFDSSGTLFAVTGGSAGPSSLITLNTTTAASTLVGNISGIQGVDDLAFDNGGILYASGWNGTSGRLLTLDAATGAILTNIAMTGTGNAFAAGLDVQRTTNQVFGSRGNAGGHTEDLVSINTTTGVQTAIGGATAVISDLWFAPSGTLYGGATNGDLFTIDPTTGAKTLLFNTGITSLSGIAGVNAAAVPEPSSLMLIGGLAVCATTQLLRRRRS